MYPRNQVQLPIQVQVHLQVCYRGGGSEVYRISFQSPIDFQLPTIPSLPNSPTIPSRGGNTCQHWRAIPSPHSFLNPTSKNSGALLKTQTLNLNP